MRKLLFLCCTLSLVLAVSSAFAADAPPVLPAQASSVEQPGQHDGPVLGSDGLPSTPDRPAKPIFLWVTFGNIYCCYSASQCPNIQGYSQKTCLQGVQGRTCFPGEGVCGYNR